MNASMLQNQAKLQEEQEHAERCLEVGLAADLDVSIIHVAYGTRCFFEKRKEFDPWNNLNDAFQAAEKIGLLNCDTQDGPGTNLQLFRGGGGWYWITNGNTRPTIQYSAPTAAEVISVAVLGYIR